MPNSVPIQFGFDGKPSNWSSKETFAFIILAMNLGIYFLYNLIPIIDPKKKININGNIYFKLKFWVITFISAISIVLIEYAIDNQFESTDILNLFAGLLFIVIGNYMQTIPQNYFIGIKTPWTLSNELVWKKTHEFGGKLIFIAGVVMCFLYIIHKSNSILFLTAILLSVIIPILYSYYIYQKMENEVIK